MRVLQYDDGGAEDIQRIAAHLKLHEIENVADRVGDIFVALDVLTRHPLIGRPVAGAMRELVIGEGSRGYVARYRYDPLEDVLMVMGLRAQREAGFKDR